MTINDTLDLARDLAGQPQTGYFTNTILLKYLNIRYQENVDYVATLVRGGRYATEITMNITE